MPNETMVKYRATFARFSRTSIRGSGFSFPIEQLSVVKSMQSARMYSVLQGHKYRTCQEARPRVQVFGQV